MKLGTGIVMGQGVGVVTWISFSLKVSVLNGLIPRVALLKEVQPLGDGLVTGLKQSQATMDQNVLH